MKYIATTLARVERSRPPRGDFRVQVGGDFRDQRVGISTS